MDLTKREREVLALICRGRTNAEIARSLFLCTTTAKVHVQNILSNTGARNRVELAYLHGSGRLDGREGEECGGGPPCGPAPAPPRSPNVEAGRGR